MELKDRLDAFKEELALIKTPYIKEFAEWILGILPDYYFVIPASSSGKYHPAYALGDGGLVRHTKAACRIAHDLMNKGIMITIPKQEVADAIICGLLFHDGTKSGVPKGRYTVPDHAVLVCEYVEKKFKESQSVTGIEGITEAQRNFIYGLVRSHMGQWDGDGMCPRPADNYQEFVHMCDYLASRKYLPFDFEANFK